MSRQNGDLRWTPSPEQLAAYADGELDHAHCGLLREHIEKWLARNPDGLAEVGRHKRLLDLWRQTEAAEPPETAWIEMWNRIKNPPPPAVRKSASPWRGARWTAALLLLAAASLLVAALLTPDRDNDPSVPETVQPFPVAGADEVDVLRVDGTDTETIAVGRLPVDGPLPTATSQEVEILRVNGADTDVLVVGELPAHGPMVLAKAGDVTLVSVDPAGDNMKPEVRVNGPNAPMIWAPLPPEPVK